MQTTSPSQTSTTQDDSGRDAPQLAIERMSQRDRDNYEQAMSLAQRLGLPQDQAQNFSMAMAAQIRDNGQMQRTDRMIAVQGAGMDGSDRVFASFHPHGDKEPIFNTYLDVERAKNVPAVDSAQRIEQLAQSQEQSLQSQRLAQDNNDPAKTLRA